MKTHAGMNPHPWLTPEELKGPAAVPMHSLCISQENLFRHRARIFDTPGQCSACPEHRNLRGARGKNAAFPIAWASICLAAFFEALKSGLVAIRRRFSEVILPVVRSGRGRIPRSSMLA